MQHQQAISTALLAERVGKTIEVIVDEIDGDGAIARSAWDAPEIDGSVYLNGETGLVVGDRARVIVEASDEYDLWASLAAPATAHCTRAGPRLGEATLR